jgi:hypothetical protein
MVRVSVVTTRVCTCSGVTAKYRDVKFPRAWTLWILCLCEYASEMHLIIYRDKGYGPVPWIGPKRIDGSLRSRCKIWDDCGATIMYGVDVVGVMVYIHKCNEARPEY